ncbi:glycosyl transferase [Clavulina sp. PMI_390]|nr:glycosyl transferase [Clavulina sp. PMI_390]
MALTALITVGSTKFDDLIQHATSTECINALQEKGFTKLIIQYGNTLTLAAYSFKPTLAEDIEQADLLISHAGSGTILEALRSSKQLIVVPNNTLMDDHQSELANELGKGGYLVTCRAEDLATTILAGKYKELNPFPQQDKSRFRDLLDKEMGFL